MNPGAGGGIPAGSSTERGSQVVAGTSAGRYLASWLDISGIPAAERDDAAMALAEIRDQGGVRAEIYRWLGGGWQGHFLALPDFQNFPLTEDEGYFVKCTQGTTYTPGGN
jgi:hypothetical protein